MLVLFGTIGIVIAIFGGFAMEGGHLAALFQPVELLMIGGGAVSAFFISHDAKSIKATVKSIPMCFKSSRYSKLVYLELIGLLFEMLMKVRKEGLMSIERDIDAPDTSTVFSRYPAILADHHVVEFLTDYLRLMVSGNMDAYQIENLMDNEIDTHQEEASVPVHCIAKLSDGLPAFGIVAAVMGVVHTMESVGLPPAELGTLIAKALVGTFLGILLAYGLVAPLSTLLEHKAHESSKVYQCIKVTIIASLNGYAPAIAVEFGRKVLFSTDRPTFGELEDYIKHSKSK